MKRAQPVSVYEQVVKVTRFYLGPAAERFIDRQVENHLHKPATRLTKTDLINLIDWISIVVSLLTEDVTMVEKYINELKNLSNSSGNKSDLNGHTRRS